MPSAAIADCRGFMRGVYHVIAQKYGWYATKYGYDQGDLNWNNYLFSDDLQTVNIIEWVHCLCTGVNSF